MTEEEGREQEQASGPVPVRDLMNPATSELEAEGEPRWEEDERAFDLDGEEWLVRPSGAGSYGTGRLGAARLLALHFYRADAPDRPVREALVPQAQFLTLRDVELGALFRKATPIDLER